MFIDLFKSLVFYVANLHHSLLSCSNDGWVCFSLLWMVRWEGRRGVGGLDNRCPSITSLLHWTMIMVGWDEKGGGLDNQRPSTTYILCCIEQWWWLSFLLLAVEGKVRKRGMGGVIVHLPMTSLSLWPIMMVWKFEVANFF